MDRHNAAVAAELITMGVAARDLGPRGSRSPLSGSDPTAALPRETLQVLAAVPGWWSARAHAAGLAGKWLDVSHAVAAPPPRCLRDVAPAEGISLATNAHDLGEAYVRSLSPQLRARHGRHYTPTALAGELWLMARRGLGMRQGVAQALPGLVRDPACGAGALLLPPLQAHLRATRHADPQVVLAGLAHVIDGIETDPAAAWLASVGLAAQALPLLAATPARRRQPLPALARLGDGLAPHDVRARLSMMNPPYGRVRLTDADRERFASTLYGHANLYGLFLAAALGDIDEDGVIAALVPTSFMSGRYFQNLRRELGSVAPIREIGFVADRSGVFSGVLQETCLAVFGRRRARRVTIARLTGTGKASVAQVSAPSNEDPWILPRCSNDAIVAAASLSMPFTLRTAGWRASTGPLVWNRRKDDLSAEPGPCRYPIIWAADIDGGRLHRDVVRDRMRYLAVHGPRDRSVMLLTEPALLVQRTTAPEQSRRLVSVRLTAEQLDRWGGAVVVENHVNVLRSTTVAPLVSVETLEFLLATEVFDRVMRSMSGSVAVSAYELESIPLPGPEVLAIWRGLSRSELEVAVKSAFEGGTITSPGPGGPA